MIEVQSKFEAMRRYMPTVSRAYGRGVVLAEFSAEFNFFSKIKKKLMKYPVNWPHVIDILYYFFVGISRLAD